MADKQTHIMKTREETVCGLRLSDYGLELPTVTVSMQYYPEENITCDVCAGAT